jgi:hypothetical protein
VAEIERVFAHEKWTLVGGLMAQLHCIQKGLDVIRPTNDVDIVLHVETTRGVAAAAAAALESLGYELSVPTDPRVGTAHRFRRGPASVDLLATRPTWSMFWWPTMPHHAWPRSCGGGPWSRLKAARKRCAAPSTPASASSRQRQPPWASRHRSGL